MQPSSVIKVTLTIDAGCSCHNKTEFTKCWSVYSLPRAGFKLPRGELVLSCWWCFNHKPAQNEGHHMFKCPVRNQQATATTYGTSLCKWTPSKCNNRLRQPWRAVAKRDGTVIEEAVRLRTRVAAERSCHQLQGRVGKVMLPPSFVAFPVWPLKPKSSAACWHQHWPQHL